MTDGAMRALHYLRRGVGLTLLVLVLALVAVFAAIAVPQLVGAERSYVVLSGSMEPTLEPGDVILVDEVDVEAVEKGQIVTFADGQGVTTHRVVDVVRDGEPALRTQGDTNPEPDPGLVTNDQLVGRVMTIGGTPIVIPYAGHLVEAARTQLGIYALVLIPLTLLILNEVYTRLGRSETHDRSTAASAEPLATTHALAEGAAVGSGGATLKTDRRSAASETEPAPATADGLDPRVFRLTPIVLLVLAAYGAWMTIQHGSPLAATVAGGSGVALILLGAARLQIRRRGDDLPPPPAGLVAGDATVALFALLLAVPLAGWFMIQQSSIASGMVAGGGAVGFVLLGIVRLQLWWTQRRAERDATSETPEGTGV
ncbi:MAG: signal peptidase I [Salinirussus sp.]